MSQHAVVLTTLARTVCCADGLPNTIFQKILDGDIPSNKVYDDETVYAFRDIAPAAEVHIVIIPKQRDGLTGIAAAQDKHAAVLGHMMVAAAAIAKQEGLEEGYRLVVNQGPHGCQSVDHLHIHLIGGQQLTWPPGTGKPEGSMTG